MKQVLFFYMKQCFMLWWQAADGILNVYWLILISWIYNVELFQENEVWSKWKHNILLNLVLTEQTKLS